MIIIDTKQFPTVWSDLFIGYKSGQDLDREPALTIECITEWIAEYHNLPADTASGDLVTDLYKRGCEVNNYLPTVKARMNSIFAKHKLAFSIWASKTKSSYTGEKQSEASRERKLLTEEQYYLYQNDLINLETLLGWCVDMTFAIKENIYELQTRIKKIISEQPPVQR